MNLAVAKLALEAVALEHHSAARALSAVECYILALTLIEELLSVAY